uniref:Uncharacterized protein n=1 Tax=viral metagenome TaxID=1070528 RepID=A0A6C0HKN2_9ZZZZ
MYQSQFNSYNSDGGYNGQSSYQGGHDGGYGGQSSYQGGHDGGYGGQSSYQGGRDGGYGDQSSYQGGHDGGYGGQSGYQGGRSGHGGRGGRGGQSGYQGGRGGQTGYQGGRDGQSGYQGSRGGGHDGQSGYQGGQSGYQGGQSGYQGGRGGQSGYQGGQSSYQGGRGGQSGYQGSRGGQSGYQGGRGGQSGYQGSRGGRGGRSSKPAYQPNYTNDYEQQLYNKFIEYDAAFFDIINMIPDNLREVSNPIAVCMSFECDDFNVHSKAENYYTKWCTFLESNTDPNNLKLYLHKLGFNSHEFNDKYNPQLDIKFRVLIFKIKAQLIALSYDMKDMHTFTIYIGLLSAINYHFECYVGQNQYEQLVAAIEMSEIMPYI